MAERPADVAAKIANIRQLHGVVTAMRGIAASRAQEARNLLPGIDAYSEVVAQSIGQALALIEDGEIFALGTGPLRQGWILFCAEQGFAGAFSEHVLEAAGGSDRRDLAKTTVFILGTRGTSIARERGIKFSWSAAMAMQADAVVRVAIATADALYDAVAAGAMNKVDLVFPSFIGGSGLKIVRRPLLPLDLTRFRLPPADLPPLTTLAPRDLVESLAAEYVFAQLCNAAMHAFVAENEARMMAMSAAKTNIEEKLVELSRRERQLRQEAITTEIIELAAGAEALQGRR